MGDRLSLAARLDRLSIPEPNTGCLIWLGATDGDDYPQMRVEGKTRRAYVIAYKIVFGSIPEGLELDHKCRLTLCVNPWHLEPVTHAENIRRRYRFNPKTHCRRGHPFSGDNLIIRKSDNARLCRACGEMRKAGVLIPWQRN